MRFGFTRKKERYKRKPTVNVGFITYMHISVNVFSGKNIDISYKVENDYVDESDLFPTKEALLQSL